MIIAAVTTSTGLILVYVSALRVQKGEPQHLNKQLLGHEAANKK